MSSKPYYKNFPAAPTVIVSSISAALGIPGIVEAKVCKDGSLILEIFTDENFVLSAQNLNDLAEFAEIDQDDLFVEASGQKDVLVVSLLNTCWDFRYLFKGTRWDDGDLSDDEEFSDPPITTNEGGATFENYNLRTGEVISEEE